MTSTTLQPEQLSIFGAYTDTAHHYIVPAEIYKFIISNYHDGIAGAAIRHYQHNKKLPSYLWDGMNEYNVKRDYADHCFNLARSLAQEGVF